MERGFLANLYKVTSYIGNYQKLPIETSDLRDTIIARGSVLVYTDYNNKKWSQGKYWLTPKHLYVESIVQKHRIDQLTSLFSENFLYTEYMPREHFGRQTYLFELVLPNCSTAPIEQNNGLIFVILTNKFSYGKSIKTDTELILNKFVVKANFMAKYDFDFTDIPSKKIREKSTHKIFDTKIYSKSNLLSSPTIQKFFENEIRILQQNYNNDQVVQLVEIHETKAALILILENDQYECLTYDTLKFCDFYQKVEIVRQLLEVFQNLHKFGYVHTNITPKSQLIKKSEYMAKIEGYEKIIKEQRFDVLETNVKYLVKEDACDQILFKIKNFGAVEKIMDTTTWKEIDYVNNQRLRQLGYQCPSLLLKNEDVPKFDTKCDVFSLGCVIFELFTGNKVFVGKDQEELEVLNRNNISDLKGFYESNISLDCMRFIQSMIKPEIENRVTIQEALESDFLYPENMMYSSNCNNNIEEGDKNKVNMFLNRFKETGKDEKIKELARLELIETPICKLKNIETNVMDDSHEEVGLLKKCENYTAKSFKTNSNMKNFAEMNSLNGDLLKKKNIKGDFKYIEGKGEIVDVGKVEADVERLAEIHKTNMNQFKVYLNKKK